MPAIKTASVESSTHTLRARAETERERSARANRLEAAAQNLGARQLARGSLVRVPALVPAHSFRLAAVLTALAPLLAALDFAALATTVALLLTTLALALAQRFTCGHRLE